MRCLVTGGSGFFGHLLVEQLIARGEEVRNFDLIAADDEPEGVDFHQGDIRDEEAVRRACEGVEVIYHNVAQQPLSKNPALMRTVNLDGTRNLLSAALDAGVRKTIFTSSTAIFGIPSELPDQALYQAHAVRALRAHQGGLRGAVQRLRREGPRHHHDPAAHHSRPRTARHLPDAVRMDP